MKKITTLIIFSVLTLCVGMSVSAQNTAVDKPLKAAHEGLECADCHFEETPVVSVGVTCTECHGSPEDVAALTADRYKQYYNPHDALHYGTYALCENCHREHEPSRLECNNPNCHGEFQYDVP